MYITLLSQTPQCASHCRVKLHTAESNYTPQSQTSHRRVKLHTAESNYTPRSQTTHHGVKLHTAESESKTLLVSGLKKGKIRSGKIFIKVNTSITKEKI